MKQSIGLVVLQIIAIALGLVSVFWVAGSLSPEVYAVVGVYGVINAFMMVFSSTGIETVAIRNVLTWKEGDEKDKIKLIVTQAITFRMVLGTIIVLPLIVYAIYVSKYKFDGNYLALFILMSVFSITQALNDSIILILKAFNKYLESAFVSYSVSVFGRLIALFLFFKFGFNAYIYTLLFLPLITIIPVFFIVREWISFKGVFFKSNVLHTFKDANSFRFSSYVGYAFGYLDQLIVSIFMSPEILGSFTVAKRLLAIAKKFIENIFDPMIQNLIRFKNNNQIINVKLKKILKVKNMLLLCALVLLPFLIIYIDSGLKLMHLNNYVYLNYFAICIYLSQIAHIGMKVNYNYITLFYKASFYLRLTIVYALISIFSFIVIISIDVKFVFSYILITNFIMMFYTNKIYKKHKNI